MQCNDPAKITGLSSTFVSRFTGTAADGILQLFDQKTYQYCRNQSAFPHAGYVLKKYQRKNYCRQYDRRIKADLDHPEWPFILLRQYPDETIPRHQRNVGAELTADPGG